MEKKMEIREKKINCGIAVTINTGDFENVRVFCEKSATFVDAAPEEEKELHKQLFKECMEDILRQGNFALKKLQRNAVSIFPEIKKETSNEL
jgi:hypothetical protein